MPLTETLIFLAYYDTGLRPLSLSFLISCVKVFYFSNKHSDVSSFFLALCLTGVCLITAFEY